MRRILLTSVLLFITGAGSAAPTAFVNVNVIPMTDTGVVAGQTVVVDDGRIRTIGPVDVTPVPKNAVIVDGTDRFLVPGLAEMHAHVPQVGAADLDRVLTLFAANGVSLIRGMLGHPSHLELREEIAAGRRFGPRLVTAGPSLNGNSVRSPADGSRQVRAQFAAGYDFIKIHPGLTAREYGAIAATATELGMPFAGHVPAAVGLEGALAAGMTTIDHLDGYLVALVPPDADPSGGFGGFFDVLLAVVAERDRIGKLAAMTAAAGTWNVPTEALFEHRVGALSAAELAKRPEMRYMPARVVEQWVRVKEQLAAERGFDPAVAARAIGIRRALIRALHEAGAGLLLGSDAPQVFNVPGFSVHHELEFLVGAGLTPFEALATGTTAVAAFLGTNGGAVAEGRDADLVLLDADPLVDIANTRRIHGVMLGGTWYPAARLEALLQNLVEPPARM
ncbi:MAG: amidohydrolase family protein [Woeseiaceae bacterium]|nr:amidohydrolase family protein [Woeseiaceae bacterium]